MRLLMLLLLLLLLQNVQLSNAITCYQCTDCPEPFTENYPYVTLVNNTNFRAECTKTVVNLGNGRRLISKGSVFTCPSPTTLGDVQIFCCGRDFCNSSSSLRPSSSFLVLVFIFLGMSKGKL